jgi:hypothetical protein
MAFGSCGSAMRAGEADKSLIFSTGCRTMRRFNATVTDGLFLMHSLPLL